MMENIRVSGEKETKKTKPSDPQAKVKEEMYRRLEKSEIRILESQGCQAEDWAAVDVEDGFQPQCVRNVQFSGKVKIARQSGTMKDEAGVEKPCGIYNAHIADCVIGRNVRIVNTGVHIAHYQIAEQVCIEDIGRMETRPQSTFGNGVSVEVLNEAGGREVLLFEELTAQYAYLMCLHRYRPDVIRGLEKMCRLWIEQNRSRKGRVGAGSHIVSTKEIINVNLGEGVHIHGVSSLINGTVLSSPEAPTSVGPGIIARDFMIAEGSTISDGVILHKSYVGQGCRVGRGFSAENTLLFANGEAFHGEACSVFAGPYTVTHHKGTLLIAGLFSFYNAGSGTNQSNHMYKLGPVHEGRLERGVKTGSFCYLMWPVRVGAFGVVLGKHTGTFDTADLPFSHHEARGDGKCLLIPGLTLATAGVIRDRRKWPSRDRRKGTILRDIISFDVFSPYTVGKMIRGSALLKNLRETTPKDVEEVPVAGTLVKRVFLRSGLKSYRLGIEMYLLDKIFLRLEKALVHGSRALWTALREDPQAIYSQEWVDIAGQIMPKQRLNDLEQAIEQGRIAAVEMVHRELKNIQELYAEDEWLWVKKNSETELGIDWENITARKMEEIADQYLGVREKYLELVLADAEKEFDGLSRTGFGQDGTPDDVRADFQQVRGEMEENKFILEVRAEIQEFRQRVERFKKQLQKTGDSPA